MFSLGDDVERRLDALRAAVLAAVVQPHAVAATAGGNGWLASEGTSSSPRAVQPGALNGMGVPSARRAPDRGGQDERLLGLVELARGGDREAFGLLYDHYKTTVYRFLYWRVGTTQLAEDLTSETFVRALRSVNTFTWQGKDFAAWLITIARNLVADHYKSAHTRLERATEDLSAHDTTTTSVESTESTVLAGLTNDMLLAALGELPSEQQECLVLRFLQSLSIAETAKALGRSEGAIKQLQLRAVRNLAKRVAQ